MKHAFVRIPFLLMALLFAALYAAALGSALPYTARSQPIDRLQVVRISAPTAAQRERLSALGLDLLEYAEAGDRFAIVGPAQLERLREGGWDVRAEPAQTALLPPTGLRRQAAPEGYRTVEQTEQFLRDIAAAHPATTTLIDYGDSWQKTQPDGDPGYDLLALRITHPNTSTTQIVLADQRKGSHSLSQIGAPVKPVFVLLAAIHARELATSELATRFVDYLLSNDGSDPTVTWLLDDYEIVVIPVANPDGRKLADQGWLQRKNTNIGTIPCPIQPFNGDDHTGVDLNRNASFQWNNGGSSPQPCNATYHGPGPASEPEEVALETFLRGLFPDVRGPSLGDAAPDDTPGVLISLHSYGNLVLWPWGSTDAPAPNADGLRRLGQRMAALNSYTPFQSINLYPTSGTTDDWLYGERGVASFTFEVGPGGGSCGGFFPPYSCLDEGARIWPRNAPALLYAAQVARAPYTQSAGPDVDEIGVQNDGAMITVTATLDNSSNSGLINAAELYLDHSPWRGGVPVAVQAADGAFDSPVERAYAIVPAASVSGRRLLLLRGNAGGIWGPLSATWSLSSTEPRVWLPYIASQ